MAAPIETKVKASTAAAAVSGLALYVLGRYVFKGTVPDVVASWVYAIVPAVITFGAGYLAKHAAKVIAVPVPPAPSGGYPAGGTPVSEMPPPPPSATQAAQPPTAGPGA